MATILNIETSTDVCSVCIARDKEILALRETERSYSHSEVIALFIKDCLEEANLTPNDLNAVSISRGPGSYTALRIGASTAKGLCFALDIPLIAIDSMKALAYSLKDVVKEHEVIIPMIDARRLEVYRSVFDSRFNKLVGVGPIILDGSTFSEFTKMNKIHFCGDGVQKSEEILKLNNAIYHEIDCSSTYMVALSQEKFANSDFEDMAYYEPLYYKAPNITVQKKNILI